MIKNWNAYKKMKIKKSFQKFVILNFKLKRNKNYFTTLLLTQKHNTAPK